MGKPNGCKPAPDMFIMFLAKGSKIDSGLAANIASQAALLRPQVRDQPIICIETSHGYDTCYVKHLNSILKIRPRPIRNLIFTRGQNNVSGLKYVHVCCAEKLISILECIMCVKQ